MFKYHLLAVVKDAYFVYILFNSILQSAFHNLLITPLVVGNIKFYEH